MKYSVGDIVLLTDERQVQIIMIDKVNEKYQVVDVNNPNDVFQISESKVFMLLT